MLSDKIIIQKEILVFCFSFISCTFQKSYSSFELVYLDNNITSVEFEDEINIFLQSISWVKLF